MTATTRVERDSMGALDVPASALWGAQTQRALQNFPATGLRMPRGFIRALGLIKHAAAAANAELGDLSLDLATAIQAAAQVQDPTLSHLPRMLAVIAALVVAGPWMGHQIAGFAERAFTMVH